MKINNYYEIKKKNYNWAPIKLIEVKDYLSTVEVLKNGNIIKVIDADLREIFISKIHLERIGFENECLNDICATPIGFAYTELHKSLSLINFGYIVFHVSEISKIQKMYNAVMTKVNKAYNENPESVFEIRNEIIIDLDSILNINQLFERLEKWNIVVENKTEIITG